MNKLIILTIISLFLKPVYGQNTKLHIAPFKIISTSPHQKEFEINIQGEITMDGKRIGKITSGGKVYGKDNKLIYQYQSGKVVDVNGHPLVKIDDKGVVDNGAGKIIYWDNNGVSKNLEMKIIPNDPRFYPTASIIIFLSVRYR